MKIGYLMQQGVEIRRPPYDGPAIHVREVVEELKRLGHSVRVLVRLDGTIWQSDDLERYEPVPVPALDAGPLRLVERVVRRVQSELRLPYAALFESLRFALACQQALEGYDLLYERLSWMGYGGGIAARWLRVSLVLESNGDHLADLEAKGIAPQGVQRHLSLALMHRAVRRASHTVVTGDGWRTNFIERWGIAPDTITTIENGTSLVRLLSREQLRCFSKREDANHITTLAYVGGFLPWHGLAVLLRALASAIQQGTRLRLLLIGSGVGVDEARQQVQEHGLSGVVTFTGHLAQQEFAPLLAAADVGVSPYCGWKEFSGLKLFDYKAAGLPTIASGRDGQPQTLRHGETGLIVPPCDDEALAAAMIHLAGDPTLRKRMGRTARIEAENSHGWDHTVQRLTQLFATIADEHSTVSNRAGVRHGVFNRATSNSDEPKKPQRQSSAL
jgi:glycosyltransferase involved in cell wall biosynthesis